MMNVLFVTCWYPYEENPGFGVFVKEHAKAISQQPGVRLKILQIWPQKGNSFFKREIRVSTDENGIETHKIFIYSFAYKLIYLSNFLMKGLSFAYAKKSIFDNWHPDIIHGNIVFQAGIISRFFARKLNIPFVISEHWSGLGWYLKTPYVQSAAGVKAYRSAKCVFPVSHNLQELIQKKVGGDLAMHVVPNVVDTGVFKCAVQKTQNPKLKVLCVTNFNTGRAVFKLPGIILDALEVMMPEERGKFEIIFVGGGGGLEAFKNRIEVLAYTEFISCLGFLPKAEIAELMQSSDALVHPSLGETFGVVVAEALCCGLPCIVSDVPALDELVDEECGIRVSGNSAKDWKEALLLFQIDSGKYKRESISIKAIDRFNQKRIGSQIVENY